MNARHITIDLEEVQAGMVLGSTLQDAAGGTLLPKGAELTDSMLSSLRRRGIERLTIVDNTVDDMICDEDIVRERERVAGRLAVLFRKCADRGASDALRDSILQYRLEDGS